MKASQTIIPTLREIPSDASAVSHQWMLRGALIRRLRSGLYHLLPLGLRVLRKIEAIIREEMERSGGIEFRLPCLIPAELWKKSGRFESTNRELFSLKDRSDVWNVLGPTHEEPFTELMSQILKSHRDYPINVYQIHTKFRDEIRPRFGVIRSREFVMKDAYSFHLDSASLKDTYKKMEMTYQKIFDRLRLKTVIAKAHSGAMGGSISQEFAVPADIGEDTYLLSENETFSSHQSTTPTLYKELSQGMPQDISNKKSSDTTHLSPSQTNLKKIHTVGHSKIEEVAKLLKTPPNQILKSLLYISKERAIIVVIRGDREVNEVKLAHLLQDSSFRPARKEEIQTMGSEFGFVGPPLLAHKGNDKEKKFPSQEWEERFQILWDLSVLTREEWIIGANEKDYHYKGYQLPAEIQTEDISLAHSGDLSPNGDGILREVKGIEVGHIFQLGDKYSKAFEMSVLNQEGEAITPLMGCYGIGISRIMAVIIEKHSDEKGMSWPIDTAPYEIVLITITKSEEEEKEGEKFYQSLREQGADVLWDDRSLRPGVKFRDSELIGFPIRITMGKKYFQSNELEVQFRKDSTSLILQGDMKKLCEKVLSLREKADRSR